MNTLLGRLYHEQNGQALYMVCALLVVLLGMAALAIDIGYAVHAQRELQVCADAAATAGGAAMPNGNVTDPTTVADEYSGDTNKGAVYNIPKDINISLVNVTYACVTGTSASNLNMPPCILLSTVSTCASSPGCNAIQVNETTTVNTFFAKLFGFSSITLTATASASASGGGAIPYHIMLVLDTTASMGEGTDTGCVSGSGSSYSPEQCAQLGIQTLLSELAPCQIGVSNCAANQAVDEVGLMVFPGICSDTNSGVTTSNCPNATTLTDTTANSTYAPPDYTCPSTNPPIAQYNNDPEYLILGFQSDYRTSDSAGLNWSSSLVDSVGAGTNNCGVGTPGGVRTFYGGSIVAAQQYLTANHTSGVQDVMIFLSDGDANSPDMGGSVKQTVSSSQIAGMNGNLFASTQECEQAVNSAAWARKQVQSDGTSTKIYSISYGTETSGCSTDTSPTTTPCDTMSGIASSPLSQYFFSVPQTISGKTSTVCSGAVPITQLNQVFTTIAGDLESARLIPNVSF